MWCYLFIICCIFILLFINLISFYKYFSVHKVHWKHILHHLQWQGSAFFKVDMKTELIQFTFLMLLVLYDSSMHIT